MAQREKAIVRFGKLFEQECFRDLSWAQELREQMCQKGLVHSGRPVSAILCPEVLARTQGEKLTQLADHFSVILQQIETLILQTPALLNRLGLLPGEKMLAKIEPLPTQPRMWASIKTHRQNGSFRICDYNAYGLDCLLYSDRLADLFLNLQTLQDFSKGRYALTKLGGFSYILNAIQQSWSEFGGTAPPQTVILETFESVRSGSSEGRLLVEQLSETGLSVRLVSPDQLQYFHGRLYVENFRVDLVLRRLLTRELLTAHGPSHPLLTAYRDGTVCVVNSFQSDLMQRRALFELLTDECVLSKLNACDAQFLRKHIPWTRIVNSRKVVRHGQTIDLHQLALQEREHFVLCPNDPFSGVQTFVGAQMSESAWEDALRMATRVPYVLQERSPADYQLASFFQYGEIQKKAVNASVHAQLLGGTVGGVFATLDACVAGCETPLTLAPVLLLDNSRT